MSDLVGNPEDRFSRVAAHIKVGYKGVHFTRQCYPDDVWANKTDHIKVSPKIMQYKIRK